MKADRGRWRSTKPCWRIPRRALCSASQVYTKRRSQLCLCPQLRRDSFPLRQRSRAIAGAQCGALCVSEFYTTARQPLSVVISFRNAERLGAQASRLLRERSDAQRRGERIRSRRRDCIVTCASFVPLARSKRDACAPRRSASLRDGIHWKFLFLKTIVAEGRNHPPTAQARRAAPAPQNAGRCDSCPRPVRH
jgi:hypothetical protein